MDVFFDVLEHSGSREKAVEALKRHLNKKKLQSDNPAINEDDKAVMERLEELWSLVEKDRVLKKMLGKIE